MKRIVILVVLLISVTNLQAQKKEIKKAQQSVKAGNYDDAAYYISEAERFLAAADSKTRAEYYVVTAELRLAEKPLDAEQIELITQSINRANNYEITSSLQSRISQINSKIKNSTSTIAGSEFKNKNYKRAASLYKTAYQSEKDTVYLLKAANSYLLAKEYDNAFNTYNSLVNMGYTNAKTQFVATEIKSNKKVAFSSKSKRNEAIKSGVYKNPEITTPRSKLPEILRGLTLASIPINKQNATVAIIDRVLFNMSENKTLQNQVSYLYIKLDALDKYNAIVDNLIKENPNDPNLYFNSAVTSAKNNDIERAQKLYNKALEIDPNYINAKINLSLLLLDKDQVITSEMNNLGDTEADDIQYKKLKRERMKLYYELIPYLESIVKAQPQNKEFSKKLKNINSFIDEGIEIADLNKE